jgi:acyl transferase domain-containing protein
MTITALQYPRTARRRDQSPTVLVFPGQGSQWAGMAAELLDGSETFRLRLRECAAAVARYVGWDVEDVIRQRPGTPTIDRVEVVQPALWAVHVSLAALWMDHGIVPDAVVGQSQGEIAAACVAGALSLDDAARVITLRSQLFAETLVGRGGIASVAMSATALEPLLTPYHGLLDIAGDIGPATATVAGDEACLGDLVAKLHGRAIRATVIPASIPSHCHAIDPLRARLTELLAPVAPRTTDIPMWSTVTGGAIDGRLLDAEYWYANARQPVLFAPAVRSLLNHGAQRFIESSAHPVLVSAITDLVAQSGLPTISVQGTLRRNHGGLGQFRAAFDAVHTALA